MIELDEIQEPQKSNYTPIVILGVVALLLVAVGFIGYKDYVDSKAEQKLTETKYEKDDELQALKAQVQQMQQSMDLQKAENNERDPALARFDRELEAVKAKVANIDRELNQSTVPTTEEEQLFGPSPLSKLSSRNPSNQPASNSYPRPSSAPSGLTEDQLFSPPSLDRGSSSQPIRSPNGAHAEEHDLFGPPPAELGNAEEMLLNQSILNATQTPSYNKQETKVLDSPAIAKVMNYADGFVTIDGGESNNIRPGQVFQISRGPQIIGRIQIDKVYKNQADASYLNVGGGISPQFGDNVIASF